MTDVNPIRTSDITVMVEANPKHEIRTSKIVIMVEYVGQMAGRVQGPAIQSN